MSLQPTTKPERPRRTTLGPRTVFVMFLVLLAGYRFSLIDRGHFYWSDERCYLPAADLLDAVASGDLRAAATFLFEARGKIAPARPGFVLISTVPVLAQRGVAAVLGTVPEAPGYYDAASAFNVLVTLGVTVCVFALGRIWTGSSWAGLLIAVVYSLLAGANVWIRHLVPYQMSMLLSLSALCLLSLPPAKDGRAWLRICVAGVLTALGYSCYPGHYPFVLINGAVAVLRASRCTRSVLAFGLSSASVIGLCELLARSIGRSYLGDLASLSGSTTMGYAKEGYVFLWRYLRDVEGVAGIVLFVLFCAFLMLVVRRRQAGVSRATQVVMIAAVGCYLLHATLGVLVGKMVFYGRVLMVYLPFVVGGAVLALMHIRQPVLRRLCGTSLVIASAGSFMVFAVQYSRIVYPAEFLQETMTRLGRDITYPPNILWGLVDGDPGETVERFDPALTTVVDTRPDGTEGYVRLASHDDARVSAARYIGVNLKFMWYIRGRYDRFVPPAGYRLAAEAPHPEVFPATAYEGRKPWERRRVRQRKYTMRLYERIEREALTDNRGR